MLSISLVILTFEPLLAGLTFSRCAFNGGLRGTKLDAGQTAGQPDGRYNEDFLQSTVSVGLAQACPHYT